MTGMLPRRALLGLGAALALPGCALRPTLENAPPVALPYTRRIDIAAGGHVHRVMVAVPPATPPAQGWPVLYALDGDLLFALAAQLMRNRFARGPGVPTQGAVVVGLGYAGAQVLDLDARTYDYTPPAPGPAVDERGRREGGADAFLDFIDATVRPLVERAARVDVARQTLFGHSYGGLCVLHALFTRPGAFRNYVAASPSVWWRDGFILQEQARFVAGRRADAPALRLLVTQGEREAELPADPARAAIARERRGGEHLRALLDDLRAASGVDCRFMSFPGADHGSSMAPAAQQALALAIGTRA
jgi:predicted alpha/beta superfamily hydrolase